MGRVLRILGIVIVSVVVLLAAAVFIVTRIIDPNDFKPQISALAQEHANLDLDIQGDLGWTFWPSLGVSIGRVEARISGDEALFAAIDQAGLGVRVWPLLFGNVEMDAITLSGLYLDLIEDEDGGNWERIGAADAAPAEALAEETATEGDSALDIPVSIPLISLSDGRVRYRNRIDGTDIQIEHLDFRATDVRLDQPFPLALSLRYQDQDDIRIDLSLDTVLALDLEADRYQLDPMRLTASIGGLTAMPVRVNVSQRVDADLGADQIRIRDLVLEAAGTRSRGELTISGLEDGLTIAGQLRTASFNANEALAAIGEPAIETSDPAALSRIAAELTFSGPANSLIIDPLKVQLDDSTLTGRAGIDNLDTGRIVFDLDLDRIALDGYLPPSEESDAVAEGSSAPAPLSEAPLLPLEDLRALLLEGRFGIGELSAFGMQIRDFEFSVSAEDGLIEVPALTGSTLEGRFAASTRLDARTDIPELDLQASAESLQIQPIVEMLLDEDLFIGLIDLNTAIKAVGNSEKALMESAEGRFDFTLTDGTVRGMNLHNVLSNGINEMLSNYQQLQSHIAGLDDGRRPRALREDTEILDLTARTRLEKMVVYIEQLDADLDRDASIKGNGWLNIHSNDFDLEIRMRAPELSDQPRISGREWPLRCAGNLADSPARWCLPGSAAFREAGRALLGQFAADRLGVDEERLRREQEAAEQRLREEREAAEKRLREEREAAERELRDRARDRLDRLLR